MNFASCWLVKRKSNDRNEVLMPAQMQDKQTTRFAWRRWIDPLRAAIESDDAPLDIAAFEADLGRLTAVVTPLSRVSYWPSQSRFTRRCEMICWPALHSQATALSMLAGIHGAWTC